MIVVYNQRDRSGRVLPSPSSRASMLSRWLAWLGYVIRQRLLRVIVSPARRRCLTVGSISRAFVISSYYSA